MFLDRFRKLHLRSQITWVFVVLIFMTTMAIMASIWLRTAEYSQDNIERRMAGAQRVLDQYLAAKEQLLITTARVLTADFGFKQAVATQDKSTVSSALQNHGQRIQADLMMLLDLEGQLVNLTVKDGSPRETFQNALNNLPLRQQASQFLVIGHSVYQVMVLPVKAPRLIAYAVIGFRLGHESLPELQSLTGLDISLFYKDMLVISSLKSEAQAMASWSASELQKSTFSRAIARPQFSHRRTEFGANSGITALLTASLEQDNEEYYRLAYSVGFIATVTLLLALVFIRVLAKSITTPLNNLVELTKRFGRGEFIGDARDAKQSHEFTELNKAFLTMGEEITQREAEIIYQAEHDLLTGLLNRHTLQKKLDDALQNQAQVVVFGIDIKGFKQINDTMGPRIGDAVLILLAQRISNLVAKTKQSSELFATAGRISNDNFLVALPANRLPDIETIRQNLQKELSHPYELDELSLNIETYIGVANSIEHAERGETLLRRVAIAVSAAKTEGLNVRYYKTGEDEDYLHRLSIIEELKTALVQDDGSLFLTYQPKLNLRTHTIDKAEALMRWVNKEGDFVNPELFISLAEKSGLIVDLTRWVVHAAVKQIAIWKASGVDVKIAVNLSAQDIQHKGFIEYLMQQIHENNVHANQLTLELTERDIMDNEALVVDRLTNLKMVGFEISVDDYGIGQSSLSKLKDLPVDELKIDKSFILALDQSEVDQTIVKSTIDLGHKLGMHVVAEGVENEDSLGLLKSFGCDHIQGYFLSRPVKPDEFVNWLRSYDSAI